MIFIIIWHSQKDGETECSKKNVSLMHYLIMCDESDERNIRDKKLDLGWCKGYMALKYHHEEALKEMNITNIHVTPCEKYAIFSRKYYEEIKKLNNDKIHDFCFIGSLNSNIKNRLWVLDFVKKYFTDNSIFINTDEPNNWVRLGRFDYTNIISGYCPKNQTNNQTINVQYRKVDENKNYFENMRQSKFCLSPAGDSSWSFRFYEILMCESIPIVETWHHTYRTEEEAKINYHFCLFEPHKTNVYEYDEKIIMHNTRLFNKFHLLHEK